MGDAHTKKHDYHLVDPSPWPIVGSVSALVMAIGAIAFMRPDGFEIAGLTLDGPYIFIAGMIGILYTMYAWWADVIRESVQEGQHTPVVKLHLRYGMILFIASEVMFFVAWFWAYFDAAFFPNDIRTIASTDLVVGLVNRAEATGGQWPPVDVKTFDPWSLPLINTLILLLSGTTVTWAHHALLENNRQGLIWGLSLTVFLGLIFTALQILEYSHAAFSFSGSLYGATFYMATGFHGFHVIVGTICLAVMLFRAYAGHFTPKSHFGFEAAAWYWHFVDVVWLFLFAAIYVWGAGTPH
ncbi:MAG: cytochrome c oxidase subunit 3 [Pseudomonadota bacterium]